MRKTADQFIEEAQKTHTLRFDYSNVKYVNNVTPVTIICKDHGAFAQRPTVHLNGGECPTCARLTRINTNLLRYGKRGKPPSRESKSKRRATCLKRYGTTHSSSVALVIDRAKQTCMERYGVAHPTQLASILDKRAASNMEKYGVQYPKQRHMINALPMLTDRAWMVDHYHNQKKTAAKIAAELNIDPCTVGKYLRKHHIEINHYYPQSVKCIDWLTKVERDIGYPIQHALNVGEFQIPHTRIFVDGYCSTTNTIYEFHGDFWHGHPTKYDPNMVNAMKNKTMKQLYAATLARDEKIQRLGYKLVVMWENDFDDSSS